MIASELAATAAKVVTPAILSHDALLVLEQPLLHAPVEEMRALLKSQQRSVDRELLRCRALLDKSGANSTNTQTMAEMTSHLRQLQSLVRTGRLTKMTAYGCQAGTLLECILERAAYLAQLPGLDPVSASFQDWCAIRLDRLAVDYMLRRGALDGASVFAAGQAIESLVELPIFKNMALVERSLVPPHGGTTPSCAPALAWCSENKMALRKIHSTFEFELRLQEYIGLVRSRTPASIHQAMVYARKYILPWVHYDEGESGADADAAQTPSLGHVQRQARRALGLLAVGPESRCYRDLYSPTRWHTLRDAFRESAWKVYGLPPLPLLHVALSVGLSSLKTRACALPGAETSAARTSHDSNRHPDCPVCDPTRLGELARQVPFNHHDQSRLICRITGKVMDDTNPPMCLPNGHVYSDEVGHTMPSALTTGAPEAGCGKHRSHDHRLPPHGYPLLIGCMQ